MATLKENTVLAHPETGVATPLAKGQEVPDWAGGLVGDHLVEGGAESDSTPQSDGGLPPRAGKGSGQEAWQKYATDNGVEYPEGATRDEIIAAVDAKNNQ